MPDTDAQPAPPDRRYYLSTRDGRVYAVELRDGWIPDRVVGPFAGEQLRADPGDQDWSAPRPASGWNAAELVPLCAAERRRMISGVSRHLRPAGATPRRAMAPRAVTAKPDLPAVKRAAATALAGDGPAADAVAAVLAGGDAGF